MYYSMMPKHSLITLSPICVVLINIQFSYNNLSKLLKWQFMQTHHRVHGVQWSNIQYVISDEDTASNAAQEVAIVLI